MVTIVSDNINFDLVYKKFENVLSLDKVIPFEIKEEPKKDEIETLKDAFISEQELIDSIFLSNQIELMQIEEREEIDKGREVYERLLLEEQKGPILRRTFM